VIRKIYFLHCRSLKTQTAIQFIFQRSFFSEALFQRLKVANLLENPDFWTFWTIFKFSNYEKYFSKIFQKLFQKYFQQYF